MFYVDRAQVTLLLHFSRTMLIVLIAKYRYMFGVHIMEEIRARYLKYKLIALLTTSISGIPLIEVVRAGNENVKRNIGYKMSL